jgi:hypothetical protein
MIRAGGTLFKGKATTRFCFYKAVDVAWNVSEYYSYRDV